MLILGLTGPSGAGKGIVGEALCARGIPVLDTDKVYHTLIAAPSPCTEALASAFGEEILTDAGGIDRRRLAAIVFCGGEEEKRRTGLLNTITHKFVLARCEAWLAEEAQRGRAAAVLDAPLLIEAGIHQRCDLVLAVLAPYDVRLARVLARDGIPEAAARARLDAQPKDDFYRAHAHLVFINDGDRLAAMRFADEVLRTIKEKTTQGGS